MAKIFINKKPYFTRGLNLFQKRQILSFIADIEEKEKQGDMDSVGDMLAFIDEAADIIANNYPANEVTADAILQSYGDFQELSQLLYDLLGGVEQDPKKSMKKHPQKKR